MSEVTHLRIIFPLGFDYQHMIKVFWDHKEGCLVGAVLHKNDYWAEDVLTPNFAIDMEVHVGAQRPADCDLFGKVKPVPAQGLLRGEYLNWEPLRLEPSRGTGGWGWLNFRLRYDMQEGPERWTEDWTQVYTTGQAPAFYYALEERD